MKRFLPLLNIGHAIKRTVSGSYETRFQLLNLFIMLVYPHLMMLFESQGDGYFPGEGAWIVVIQLVSFVVMASVAIYLKFDKVDSVYVNCFIPVHLWMWGVFVSYSIISIPVSYLLDGGEQGLVSNVSKIVALFFCIHSKG